MVAGQYFGELALVVESARFASVTTLERSNPDPNPKPKPKPNPRPKPQPYP